VGALPIIAAISDLHGLRPRFEKAKKLLDKGIKKILIAGDIAPLGYPEAQQANVKQNFEYLLQSTEDVEVFAIPGNDDWKIVEQTLREFPEVTIPTDRAYTLEDGFSIVGYPYVPVTPFNVKDYEKWDSSEYPELPGDSTELMDALINFGINVDGFRSEGLEIFDFQFDPQDRTENIHKDLNQVKQLSDPAMTIYLFHCTPFLELESYRIGSRSITDFIIKNNPWITIHGHSHGAVDRMKGKFEFDIGGGKSVLVGAGNDPNVLNFLTFDLKKRKIERHKI
jgi:Icc-related predicted phosphoesterase